MQCEQGLCPGSLTADGNRGPDPEKARNLRRQLKIHQALVDGAARHALMLGGAWVPGHDHAALASDGPYAGVRSLPVPCSRWSRAGIRIDTTV